MNEKLPAPMSPSSWYKEFMAGAGVEVGSYKLDKPTRYTGPPMDLANMRENGVRALLVNCLDCTHRGRSTWTISRGI